MPTRRAPSGHERTFGKDEIIVTKTDLQGRITYANDVFLRVAGYTEAEVLGAAHSLVRHPDMPRSVFKLLWDTIERREEIFAYVLNMASNGDHYWVFAHVTASYDLQGRHIGYHSNRRVPNADALRKVTPLYQKVLAIEQAQTNPRAEVDAGVQALVSTLQSVGMSYGQFVFSLSQQTRLEASIA